MARSIGLGLLCFVLLVASSASATQFRVGGQKGWSVPDASAESYNAWAGRMRFQIGDQLLFVYPKETDSVLLVEPAAYNACNTSSYVNRFDDGSTVFTFDRSGPFFFISGNEASCRANEKLIVVVLADRSGTRTPPPPSSSAPMPPPAPSPASATPPSAAPLPAPAATPSSAPSPAGSAPTTTPASSPPSPSTPGGAPQPPSGSADAPSAEGGSTAAPTPPSGNGPSSASTTLVAGFVASLGAYISYAMLAI